MSIKIIPYTQEWERVVKDFNLRLKAREVAFSFPETYLTEFPICENKDKIYQNYFLAIDEEKQVRGAYKLKFQRFALKGQQLWIGHYQLPLSEGIIDKRYGLVGVQLLTNALAKSPLLYALGMGGFNQPLPKMLKSLGWSMYALDFFFYVNKVNNFLRNISFLRGSKLKKIILEILLFTGLGWIIVQILRNLHHRVIFKGRSIKIEKVEEFTDWSDVLWQECKDKYFFLGIRDSLTLNTLYPKEESRNIKLKVSLKDKVIGWVVVLDTKMNKHKQFGNMRLGSIVDGLSLPENAYKVILAAKKFLVKQNVDLIISNQANFSWAQALKAVGFLLGPSNFIFAVSKPLAEKLKPFEKNKDQFHINRGDGDGPIHL